jgi:hypothetical protein
VFAATNQIFPIEVVEEIASSAAHAYSDAISDALNITEQQKRRQQKYDQLIYPWKKKK